MADQEQDQKTEEASQKRQDKLRDEGKIAVSPDVTAAAGLVAVTFVLGMVSTQVLHQIHSIAQRSWSVRRGLEPLDGVNALGSALRVILTPILVGAAVCTLAVGMAQTRGLFSISLAMPKLERLNPASHIKKVLPTLDSFKEIGKQMFKLLLLGIIVYYVVRAALPRVTLLANVQLPVIAGEVAMLARRLAIMASLGFVAIAGADFALARSKHRKESMMSRQELKDEHKEDEGDPQIKRRLRIRMRELAANRNAGSLATATVLVTNPTHYAVGLQYEQGKDPAPVVVARGKDERALALREEARRRGIPIVENRPLARLLHAQGKVGKVIPVESYQAVAGVIAQVLRLRRGGSA